MTDPDHPVASVTRALLRLIHQRELGPGAQLPPQDELRTLPGFSNRTLGPAMQRLVDHGVISRKRRVGTLVVDPRAVVPALWRVALVVPPTASEAFYAQLLQLLQVELAAIGAVARIVAQRLGPAAAPTEPSPALDFDGIDGLGDLLTAERLDGVLAPVRIDAEDWAAWATRGVLLCHAGSWVGAPAGAVIDQAALMHDALPTLAAAGCRSIAVVGQRGPMLDSPRAWAAAKQLAARHGVSLSGAHGGRGPEGGWIAGTNLLATADRPDGLVVLDDRVATGLTAALAADGDGYRPTIVVQTNRQAPLAYALPVRHAEVDVADLAATAVGELRDRLLDPNRARRRLWVAPHLHAECAHHRATNAA